MRAFTSTLVLASICLLAVAVSAQPPNFLGQSNVPYNGQGGIPNNVPDHRWPKEITASSTEATIAPTNSPSYERQYAENPYVRLSPIEPHKQVTVEAEPVKSIREAAHKRHHAHRHGHHHGHHHESHHESHSEHFGSGSHHEGHHGHRRFNPLYDFSFEHEHHHRHHEFVEPHHPHHSHHGHHSHHHKREWVHPDIKEEPHEASEHHSGESSEHHSSEASEHESGSHHSHHHHHHHHKKHHKFHRNVNHHFHHKKTQAAFHDYHKIMNHTAHSFGQGLLKHFHVPHVHVHHWNQWLHTDNQREINKFLNGVTEEHEAKMDKHIKKHHKMIHTGLQKFHEKHGDYLERLKDDTEHPDAHYAHMLHHASANWRNHHNWRLGHHAAEELAEGCAQRFHLLSHHHRLRFRKTDPKAIFASIKDNAQKLIHTIISGAPPVFIVGANAQAQFGPAVQAGLEMDFDFHKRQLGVSGYLGGGVGVAIGEVPVEIAVSANFYHAIAWKGDTQEKNIWDATEGWAVGASVGVSIPTPWPGVGVSVGGIAGFAAQGGLGSLPKFNEMVAFGVSGGVGVSPFDAHGNVDVAWLKYKTIKKTDCSTSHFPKTCMLAAVALSPLAADPAGLAMAGGLFLVNAL